MILDATNRSLQGVLTEAVASFNPQVTVGYADHTTTAFTPATQHGDYNGTTNITLLAAPAASTQRHVESIVIMNPDTISHGVRFWYLDGATTRNLFWFTLEPNCSFVWTKAAGAQIVNTKGAVNVINTLIAPMPSPRSLKTVWLDAANLTAVTALTSGTSYAHYMGRAEAAWATLNVRHRVTTAAATITWCELAVYRGTLTSLAGTLTLARLGFTDTSAIWNSIGQKTTAVTLTGCAAGDHLWVIFGAAATTMPVFRGALADDLQSGFLQTFASRPSTTSAPATTLGSATQVPVWADMIGT